MRCGKVFCKGRFAGILEEHPEGYIFRYEEEYRNDTNTSPVSLTLPKSKQEYTSQYLFSFFAGLLTEGENAKRQCRILHLDENDLFGRLLMCAGEDTIGAVTVKPLEEY